ncbi:MAG: hypothetical protein WAQ27_01990 [Candidatus Microsaccharimonas sp.]
MSDIDFDELDRAVNGAINGTASTPVVDEPSQEDSQQETPVLKPVQRTTIASAAEAPKVTEPEAPVEKPVVSSASPAAARRSSGRFMDMVHPSSDMRSRNGAPIETKPQAAASAELPVDDLETPEEPSWNEPLESPFLPDAKVEKRPLGGATAADGTSAIPENAFQDLLNGPKEELLEAPEPQELIEASMPDPIDFAAAQAITEEIESKNLKEESAEPVIDSIDEIAPAPETAPVVEEPIGPTSITQQYKEQSSSNQESGAIFDTESYHQPVVAPVKKKSSWLVIVWILLLVILGAGVGWAVYTYVLPTL